MAEDLAYTLAGIGRRKDPYEARRALAQRFAMQGMDTSPVQSPWQGAGRLAQALAGAVGIYKADTDEKQATEDRNSKLAEAMAQTDPQKRIGLLAAVDPELGARLSGQLAVEQAKISQQREGLQTAANSFGSSYGAQSTAPPSQAGAPQNGYQGTLGGLESNNNPTALNPQSGAGGQFQFMPQTWADVRAKHPDLNLPPDPRQAPAELQAEAEKRFRAGNAQALQGAGIEPTPANLYLAHRTGAQGAQTLLRADPNAPMAAVVPPQWIAQNPDMQGKTVGQFLQLAQQRFGGGSQPVTVRATPPGAPGQPTPLTINMTPGIPQGSSDQPPGMPPAPSPQGVQGPTMVAPQAAAPAIPDVPRPRPSEAQVAQYKQRLASGEFGTDAGAVNRARAALDAEVERDWGVQRDRAKMQYEAQMGDYKDARNRTAEAGEHDRREGIKKLEPPPPFKKLATDVRTAASAIDNFENVVKETGGGTIGALLNSPNDPQAQKLLGAFETMKAALRSEAFFNTGVLQPAEAKMLDDALLSPGSIRGFMANPQAYAEKLNQFRTFMDGKLGAAYQAYGLPQPEERFSRASPTAAPSNRFVGPDGRVVTQQDIEETAKNRGMDAKAVIDRLQLRPVQ
jgi:hypothetical protein